MMTPRERLMSIMRLEKPDVLPWVEVISDSCLVRWFEEGLSLRDISTFDFVLGRGDKLMVSERLVGFDPYSYFGCTDFWGCMIHVDTGPIPRFKQRVVKENEKYVESVAVTGVLLKRLKTSMGYRMPMFLEFPVKDEKTWKDYKERLDPKDPKRYPKDWEGNEDTYAEIFERYQKGPTVLTFSGFYGFGAQLMGIPTFNVMFYKNPDLMHDMAEYWEFFIIETTRDAVEVLKDKIDLVFWWEDMAEKHGPNISPKIYREFFLPHYKKVTEFLRRNKVENIMVDSDGNVNPIINLMIEAGINGLWPLEVGAGMDAIDIRKKYKNEIFVGGNLNKEKIMLGGNTMREEINFKLPALKELGGYFPSLDHVVPEDFRLEKFKEYADYLKENLIC